MGANVVTESKPSIARARNCGAEHASGQTLLFIDADTSIPSNLIMVILQHLDDNLCFGGAVRTDYRPQKRILKAYFRMWAFIASRLKMAQGITQFVRANVFHELGGYDVSRPEIG
jgi:glycosyltransferase involved in cell wall biosynthesis